jgi:hypothetical protein
MSVYIRIRRFRPLVFPFVVGITGTTNPRLQYNNGGIKQISGILRKKARGKFFEIDRGRQ